MRFLLTATELRAATMSRIMNFLRVRLRRRVKSLLKNRA